MLTKYLGERYTVEERIEYLVNLSKGSDTKL